MLIAKEGTKFDLVEGCFLMKDMKKLRNRE